MPAGSAFPRRLPRSSPNTSRDERLTEREIGVLQHVAGGNRNREIAERLAISEETVKVHVKHIMEKLGATRSDGGRRDRGPPRHHPVVTASM